MKTLADLYESHKGKVSDKWEIYIDEYDRLFNAYRKQNISMLEVGVQNGGSLEVWSKYFLNAMKIVGCDVNPDCAKLSFDDPRIAFVLGDANDPDVQAKVLTQSPTYDIIIDDGSHTSTDIVTTFSKYFPAVKIGGLFVVEDLHCSYFQDFDGGIYHPYSSVTFFKHLVDIINHEHWGIEKQRLDLIDGFKKRLKINIDESVLAQIHSIEFLNSMCVIKKNDHFKNTLGCRVISGEDELVVSGHLALDGSKLEITDQGLNEWSNLNKSPSESYLDLINDLKVKENLLREERHASEQSHREIILKQAEIDAILSSTSWRLTTPIRALGNALKSSKIPVVKRSEPAVWAPPVTSRTTTDSAQTASFEVLSGLEEDVAPQQLETDNATVIAFYLPQYHRVQENNEWWGPGFTEWTNVVKGRPNYDGHYQPHLPREMGFYDLTNVEIMREQADMAKLYGIGAFCFYYYWFSGRRLLEKPIDNFLSSNINMPYCLCWANENWTRTWDGDTRSILMEQKYLESDPQEFIASLLPHFNDHRYLRVDGKPILVVYRAKEIPDVSKVFDVWRDAVKASGFPGLHIVVVDFYDIEEPSEVGADALVEFPPHKFNGQQSNPDRMPTITNQKFRGGIVDYAKIMAQSSHRSRPDYTLYRGVMPSWDNTARRQNTPTIVHGSSPKLFEQWLRYVRAYTRETFAGRSDAFIFINAWNEWGEGCHLEPDQKNGLRYLEAVKASAFYKRDFGGAEAARNDALAVAAASIAERDWTLAIAERDAQLIYNELQSIRPVGGLVQKIAFALRRYPALHAVGKRVYWICNAMRGR